MQGRPTKFGQRRATVQRITRKCMSKVRQPRTNLMAPPRPDQLNLHQIMRARAASLHMPDAPTSAPRTARFTHAHLGGALVAALEVQAEAAVIRQALASKRQIDLSNA